MAKPIPPQEREIIYFDLTQGERDYKPEYVKDLHLNNGKFAIRRGPEDHGLMEIVDAATCRRLAAQYAEIALMVERGFIRKDYGRDL